MLDEPQVDNKYGGTIAAPLAGEVIEDVLNYLGAEKRTQKMKNLTLSRKYLTLEQWI